MTSILWQYQVGSHKLGIPIWDSQIGTPKSCKLWLLIRDFPFYDSFKLGDTNWESQVLQLGTPHSWLPILWLLIKLIYIKWESQVLQLVTPSSWLSFCASFKWGVTNWDSLFVTHKLGLPIRDFPFYDSFKLGETNWESQVPKLVTPSSWLPFYVSFKWKVTKWDSQVLQLVTPICDFPF